VYADDGVVENSADADADADEVFRGNNSKSVMPAEARTTRDKGNYI
jgi:hypothetical protein